MSHTDTRLVREIPNLNAVVQEWEKDIQAAAPTHTYSGNTSRDLFHFVRLHPGLTMSHIWSGMKKLPFKYNKSSVYSLLRQMVKNDMLRAESTGLHLCYFTKVPEYHPVRKDKPRSVAKPKVKEAAKRGRPPGSKNIPKPEPAPETKQAPAPKPANDLDQILAQLTFTQAIELYKKLRDILGSATRMPLP